MSFGDAVLLVLITLTVLVYAVRVTILCERVEAIHKHLGLDKKPEGK